MKRIGHLMPRIVARDNLLLAFWKAERGRRTRRETLLFRDNLEEELGTIRAALLQGEFRMGPYHTFTIHDPKERLICAAPFRDRVVHHALMNVAHAAFESYQIHDSYACRPGKGTHRAVVRAEEFAFRNRCYLKLDIRHYFDSIAHDILKQQLRARFKDRRFLEILDSIIDSYSASPGRGIPIGNLTSQYFANHYLSVLDHFVKEELRCRCYIRYMDDFVLWSERRETLMYWREAVTVFLRDRLSLTHKPECMNSCGKGMTFLGYRVYPGRITLARRSRVRFRRKLEAAHRRYVSGEWSEAEAARHVEPLLAFVRHGRSERMRQRILADFEGVFQQARTG